MNLRKSLIWTLVLPVPVAALIGVVAMAFIMPAEIADNVKANAADSATQIVRQFKTIRGYYTKNVIKKVVKDGNLKPSFNHATEEKGVPLPATFIHDVSKLLAEEDTSVSLYSPYPFPNRADRKLDGFQQAAWDHLVANPDGKFIRQETIKGKTIVRVGIADKMVAEGCVNCHNKRADTPKNDWKLNDVRGVLEVATAIDGAITQGSALSKTVILGFITLGVILSAITALVASRTVNQIKGMTIAMGTLADGDTDVEIPGMDSPNEIGAMAHAMEVFKDGMRERFRMQAEHETAEEKAKEDRRNLRKSIADELENNIGDVVEAVAGTSAEMRNAAENLASTAQQASSESQSASGSADNAASNVQTVAAAAEELSSSISEISSQVSQSTKITSEAVTDAQSTNEKIQSLAIAAQKVGEVVNLITDIAEQTNLLALNATIEAARAGDAGKGFAVVASEVKNLANQTARATEEISAQINGIQSATSESVTAIKKISSTINQVNDIAAAIAAAVEEQGAATQEIARSVDQASTATQEVSTNIHVVNAAATETGNIAGQIGEVAGDLDGRVAALKKQVSEFADRIRTA